ncbi:ligand-binding sensor domain-containing protein [Paraflavitalea pollutisoli]|uniref:ligand-binding sensor domain-containing protein n=1 Tax=Paraflavitalea pollutisoli TaxID=3034143 RepID=UPI0023EB0CAA|nr:two-component regulator propeller domain-containing protein [Paraflavitalea sp. H1-2-19X]
MLLPRLLIASFILLGFTCTVTGQEISFSRLSTAQGLTGNNGQSVVLDKNGFLWIGTNDGLNVFDGYTVTNFVKDKYPEMPSDVVLHLMNDRQNRTWLGTYSGAAWVDENRRFHRVTIRDTVTRFRCPSIFETASYGVVLHAGKGQYYFDSTAGKWKQLEWLPDLIGKGGFVDAEPVKADQVIFITDSVVSILDYKTRKLVFRQVFEIPLSACRATDTSIAVGLKKGKVMLVNISNGRHIATYQLVNQLGGKTINANLTEVRRAANGDLLVATDFAGLTIIDAKGHITSHIHDPLNPSSISGNNIYRAYAGKNGEIIVGTKSAGINMANVYNRPAAFTRIFSDEKGNLYDNYITKIVEAAPEVFWVGGNDRLIKWNRRTNRSEFYHYYVTTPDGTRPLEIRAMAKDRAGKLWLSAAGDGLCLFDQQKGQFKKISFPHDTDQVIRSPYIYDLHTVADGTIWVGTARGAYVLNPVTGQATAFAQHAVLKELMGKMIIALFQDREQRIWIGTHGNGIYSYDGRTNQLSHLTTKEGLPGDIIYGFTQDNSGALYAGTAHGFVIIPEKGALQIYNRRNGLSYERCESLLKDSSGSIWITNSKSLVRFDPVKRQITHFEQNSGLSIDGFISNAAIRTTNGELLLGTEKGINAFYPDRLVITPSLLQVSVYAIDTNDSLQYFGSNARFSLPYNHNDITFHFTAVHLNGSRNIEYQYMLKGYDREWHAGTDIREARYPSLPAGQYSFQLRASIDRVKWTNANNEISITIVPPIWQRWWFITAAVIALALIMYTLYRWRLKQVREKEMMRSEYNQRIAEIEMKALRAQMNPHFIFNCLNSINRYIVKSDHATASLYLTRFSKLIRLILDNSNSKNVLLANELEALRIYMEMESLRFNNKFTYEILVDEDVVPEIMEVPPLIIQPYVENAIWHGLLHKETAGHLIIHLSLVADNMLQCVVEDNGVGRERAMEFKSKSATTKKSLGMKLTEDRIAILNKHTATNASITIVDLHGEQGTASGTKVILKMPV